MPTATRCATWRQAACSSVTCREFKHATSPASGPTATVLANGGACVPASETIVIPMATWNAWVEADAPRVLSVTGNGAVGAFECGEPTWVRLRLAIPRANPRDVDGDRIPDDCAACPADLDESGAVDFADLVALLSEWGPCAGCAADLDQDDAIGFGDLVVLLAAWGEC